MRNLWTIAVKEYKTYFSTATAYVVSFFILLVVGGLFYVNVYFAAASPGMSGQPPNVQAIIGPLMFILVFTCPAVTMRLLSEEQRLGTIELLLTAPVRDWELVVGKWLGGFMFVMTVTLVTMIYPITLNWMVDPGIDQGLMIAGYLGIALTTSAFLGLGVAISAMFSSQIASYLVTMPLFVVLWWITGIFSQVGGPGGSNIIRTFDFAGHFYETFMRGVVDLRDLVFFVSVTIFGLVLGSVIVEMRRWR